jgi:hypothetical protein
MTPEQIAELRQIVRNGFDLGRALSEELLDDIEAAQAEITHVRGIMEAGDKECRHREERDRVYRTKITILENQIADLKRGGVVVPEYPENSFDVRMAVQKAGGMADFDQGVFRAGWEFLASRLRTIPADRELGEGEARIGMNELRMLRDFAGRRMSEREHDRLEAVRDAHEDALRAQPTQEPAT